MRGFIVYIIFIFAMISLLSCKETDLHQLKKSEGDIKPESQYITITADEMAATIALLKKDSLSTIKLKNKDSIIAFYSLRKDKAAWKSLNNRTLLYTVILNSKKHGLNPSDYNKAIIKTIISTDTLNLYTNAVIDLLLTDSYLSYSYHLANGKINPKELYNDWKLNANIFNFNSILNQSINNNSLLESFEKFAPNSLVYKKLKKQLPIAKALVNTDSLRIQTKTGLKIRPFKSNERILNIRKRLLELDFLKDTLAIKSDVLDSLLQVSIKSFQASKKLKTDAIIGDETINALNETYQDKYNSILANLERWRWFPRNFGKDYIRVNIADYSLKHITKTDTSFYNVIVGKNSRKTPVFSSKVDYLDFNPKWFIPPTIKREDIIPAAKKDLNYLRKKNISVFHKGEKLILDSINWNSIDPMNYSYVQDSGNSNSLGRVKIIFPNDFSVYLHDTPSKSLFKRRYRARSSGCVRVQNVYSLASEILNIPKQNIIDLVDTNKTQRIHTDKHINVHFLYWTVTFNNETPVFLNDVYNFDNELAQKLTY